MNREDHLDFRPIHLLYIPNILSLLRLPLSVMCLNYVISGGYKIAVWYGLAAILTDFFDGRTAGWLNQRTKLGLVLEPLMDNTIIVMAVIVEFFWLNFPGWVAGGVLLYMLAKAFGFYYFFFRLRYQIPIPAEFPSKIAAVCMGALLFFHIVIAVPYDSVNRIIFWILVFLPILNFVTLMTLVWSLITYWGKTKQLLNDIQK